MYSDYEQGTESVESFKTSTFILSCIWNKRQQDKNVSLSNKGQTREYISS